MIRLSTYVATYNTKIDCKESWNNFSTIFKKSRGKPSQYYQNFDNLSDLMHFCKEYVNTPVNSKEIEFRFVEREGFPKMGDVLVYAEDKVVGSIFCEQLQYHPDLHAIILEGVLDIERKDAIEQGRENEEEFKEFVEDIQAALADLQSDIEYAKRVDELVFSDIPHHISI